jgi:hypothetical protein
MTSQKNAQELLDVLVNSQSHNPAWALKEVLEKLREKLDDDYWRQNSSASYVNGYDDCLTEISAICNELEAL